MKVAVVGATGLVGQAIIELLEKRGFPIDELIPVASAKSIGKSQSFKGRTYPIVSFEEALSKRPQLALFSAGGAVSKEWAPAFARIGCYVVDNSSMWRMDPNVKLIVPEVNGNTLRPHDHIIANPNCSTIQMVMVLKPLYDKYGIKRVVVSTYQSVSGSGQKGIDTLVAEREGRTLQDSKYPHPIDLNVLPHIDTFLDNGYTKEEMKMIEESRKILGDPQLKITATTVRVPVMGGHSESLNIELATAFDLKELRTLLSGAPGVVVLDDPARDLYPMPVHAQGKDEVFVGRLRKDDSAEHALNAWIVADNLRKGAATNAVQIAEYLVAQNWPGQLKEERAMT